MGPDTYDLVSLLRDSYVDLDRPRARRADRLLPRAEGRATPRADDEFRRRFDLMALQRNLKALGTFGFQTIDARQHRLHPVHAAHAALRRAPTSRSTRASPACASCSRRTSRSCGRRTGTVTESSALRLDRSMPDRDRSVGTMSVSLVAKRQFGVSTHLYHGQRLTREHLLEIAAHGFEPVEVFATRTHFDYHNPAAVADLQQWLAEAGPRAAQRARADRRELHRRPLGRAADAGQRRRRRARARGGRSRARAAHRAADSVRACWSRTSACRARSARRAAGREQPRRRRGAASRSCSGWREPLGVRIALEVIPNELSRAGLAGALRRRRRAGRRRRRRHLPRLRPRAPRRRPASTPSKRCRST